MKHIIAIFLFILLLINTTPQTYAAYGAGTSKGWPNTTDGAKGKIVAPFYKTPPNAYTVGETITLVFKIENPENNTQLIATDLFLHIWKVEKADPEKQAIAEDQLNQDHTNKKDAQSLYRVISVGQLALTPGEVSEFKTTFTIDKPGYYQFDLTNLTQTAYAPGHIYAAGFLRVKGAGNQAILGAQTTRETSSISGKLLFLSLFGSLLAVLFFLFWKRRNNNARTFFCYNL